jgi:BirA family biotin operon repressor/biotin-[acetyl-CoA-carboxylase] ligase
MATKDLILQALEKAGGAYLSGEALSEKLGVSRTAVWKAINSLRDEGYRIEAVTNRGYLLIHEDNIITEESLRGYLPTKYKKNKLYLYDTIDSTNVKAKQLALEKVDNGTVVLAMQQTGGRGRLGRSFFSPREGIYLSIIIKPDFQLSQSVLITSAAAVAVAQAIEDVCGKEAKIKWVNDVYVDGKKVSGILTEGITDFETGQIDALVIGIGLNTTLNGFPKELLDTVGAVDGEYSKSALAAQIISRTLDFAADIESRSFIKPYKDMSMVIGENVKVYKGKYKINPDDEVPGIPARVLDIDDDGCLVVLYSNGTQEVLASGEITIRKV